MFENIIEQGAVLQLKNDIINGRSAPSMLFFGPGESGKGSAALELARVLSCEQSQIKQLGDWKCACPSCERHRILFHDDLLALGSRSFSAEIAACSSAFLRNPQSPSSKHLFFRSIRKLQLRFSPVLMEDDPKYGKISGLLQNLDEGLNEFWDKIETMEENAREKLCASIEKNALSLESDGLSSNIPIGQIRKASWWCRLAPNGKRKTLIIENAENMRDEARNSLLKLLEEPPSTVSIVLTAKRREAIMPTILSRLRPYRFLKRDGESEKEVIRRIFLDNGESISGYLDSFMPQSAEKLYPLAAWFIVSLARIVSVAVKKNADAQTPLFLSRIGERYAPIADEAGLEKTLKSAAVIKTIVSKTGGFEESSFSRFMKICLELICDVSRHICDPSFIVYNEIIKKQINETVTAVDILNINAAIALESLFYNLKTEFKKVSARGFHG